VRDNLPPVTLSAAGAPESFGPYRLLEKLGHGGMAVVYRGERVGEAGFKKRVAIKRILPQYRRDPSLLERFAAEARTNARLDHPNLVQVLDFGIDPEPYLVLEFVEGVSLSQILSRLVERKEQLELSAALFIAAEAATGLDHAHRKKGDDGTPLGIVHRDVSPQNVLVSNEGAVKVSDFGLVKAADNVLKTASGVSIGKISYMAPEQARGETIDARADIFSLGVMIWEMLTLRSLIPPDDPGRAAVLLQSGAFEPPSRFNPKVPERLDRIVMSCLEVDLERRTPTAQQASLELRELLHETAAGYGRQQLARMVGWLFPEKGWAIAEPDQPAAQPSVEERLSMPMITPAAVAIQRVADASSVPPAPVMPVPAMPAPAPPSPTRARRIALVVGAGAFVVFGGLAIAVVALAFYFYGQQSATAAPTPTAVPPPLTAPMVPIVPSSTTPPPQDLSVALSAPVPGVRLFIGAREIGTLPIVLRQHELTGEPLIAIAAGHEPRVVRSELLLELMRTQPAYVLTLEPTTSPDLALYVRYQGQGIAHLASGDDLGPVPGVVLVPRRDGEPPETSLVIWDESGQETTTLSLDGCSVERVCLLTALAH
jgi:tRNA A-37 threonylcarbamoyl transferase component Bud32